MRLSLHPGHPDHLRIDISDRGLIGWLPIDVELNFAQRLAQRAARISTTYRGGNTKSVGCRLGLPKPGSKSNGSSFPLEFSMASARMDGTASNI